MHYWGVFLLAFDFHFLMHCHAWSKNVNLYRYFTGTLDLIAFLYMYFIFYTVLVGIVFLYDAIVIHGHKYYQVQF